MSKRKNLKIWWVISVVLITILPAQAIANSAPVVSNVTASQRTDGSKMVDIYYDLTDVDGDLCTVSVEVSDDGGSTWDVLAVSFTGDIGEGITTDTGKLIIWDCGADLPGAYGTSYKVRVSADEGYEPPQDQDMVLIPAGEFEMGDHHGDGYSKELPVHAVLLDAFFMSKFEITNSQYCDYLNSAYPGQIKVVSGVVYASSDDLCDYPYCYTSTASSYSQIDYSGGVFSVATKDSRDMSDDPMVEVSWYGAAAYCNWRSGEEGYESCYNLSTWDCNFSKHGYRLPTEAEWEYAARGGLNGKRFPWSDLNISHSRANYFADPYSYPYDKNPTSGYHPNYNDVKPYTAPVCSFAANGYGLYDMAGNVFEWCNDWYGSDYYDTSPYDNPKGPASAPGRVVRGGGWGSNARFCRVAYRYDLVNPGYRFNFLGFRFVLDSDFLGGQGSAESNIFTIDNRVPQNTAPVADAGDSQTVHAGTVVTLDGSGSSDPDGDYPLTYAWEIVSTPLGSTATLSDPTLVNPTFTADMLGDYMIELVVTDSLGLASETDEVWVSTYNSAPVAEAGPDQAVIEIGTTVQLDGTQSWDDDGDPIDYSWAFLTLPPGSSATLPDPTSATPTFVADVHGEYVIELFVSDPWIWSDPDTVTVSFENVQPVANAGGSQAVIVGETVSLDGSGSYDANFDLLSYSWSFVSKPSESLAELSDANVVNPSFIVDEPGVYVVSLVVSDSFVNSDAANVTVMAITCQEAAAITLVETVETVNLLDPNSLKNENLSNALTNKINAALAMIDEGLYQDALDKLVNDILQKTNGCADTGQPDKNDWIITCEEQGLVYPLVIEAIELLENLI